MIRTALASLAVLLVGGAATPRQTAPTTATFNLVIESTATGWAAECSAGCLWRRVSFACNRACDAVIDAGGVNTTGAVRRDSTSFRFTVAHTAVGARAVAETGTYWKGLSWSCGAATCRADVTQYGVSGIERTP